MPKYYVNKNEQSNGSDHEVHAATCSFLPKETNRLDLGEHKNCYTAVVKARKEYSTADGCYYCAPDCHKR